ncbi:hypothetical protein [Saccharopolyspora phatthalungensis]|uniref:Uncharacterized protein n=1 Tax=Saccharopolyspora phatthalungensis TaxID=664693 RepID=A0A840QJY5_9PSEU|nr:hypothetical protein [Saccharopolyspora phatthalungensis]MBB5159445.1 hypothetical protein [Saccharopolyspora phatthalungensis]
MDQLVPSGGESGEDFQRFRVGGALQRGPQDFTGFIARILRGGQKAESGR